MLYDNLQEVSVEQLIQAKNWQAQYRLITDWGRLISPKPLLHQEQYLIKGCETPAWLAHDIVDGQHRFAFDSHSRVINGLVAILLSLVDNKMSAELSHVDIENIFLTAGLEKHLTPSRNNGLKKIIEALREFTEIN